jgi:hypothetical protein
MQSDTLADARVRLDFKNKIVNATLFNSDILTGTLWIKDDKVHLDLNDNLFMTRYLNEYKDMNYAGYVLLKMLNIPYWWIVGFDEGLLTLASLASTNAPTTTRFLPPVPPNYTGTSPITGTFVGDFFAYLDDWATSNNVSFIEYETKRDSVTLITRWDRYTIYITTDYAMVTDNAGNVWVMKDPDEYKSITAHLYNLTNFGNAYDAAWEVYKPNIWAHDQVGPTIFEYVFGDGALWEVASLKYSRAAPAKTR